MSIVDYNIINTFFHTSVGTVVTNYLTISLRFMLTYHTELSCLDLRMEAEHNLMQTDFFPFIWILFSFISFEWLQVYRFLYLQCRHSVCVWGTAGPCSANRTNDAELRSSVIPGPVLYNTVSLYIVYSKSKKINNNKSQSYTNLALVRK